MQHRYPILTVVLVAAVIAFVFPFPSLAEGGELSTGDVSAEPALSAYWPYSVRQWESIIVQYADLRSADAGSHRIDIRCDGSRESDSGKGGRNAVRTGGASPGERSLRS